MQTYGLAQRVKLSFFNVVIIIILVTMFLLAECLIIIRCLIMTSSPISEYFEYFEKKSI